MILRHRVALNGVQLDSVDSRIMITKIEEGEGKEQMNSVSLYGGSGCRVTSLHRDYLDVTVKFQIRLRKREMTEREEVLDKVNAWACKGGWLSMSYKENRRIYVFRQQAASMGDAWNWTREYAITFRACGVPYWQQENANRVQRGGTAGEDLTFGVDGTADSVLDVQFQNTCGSTVSTLTIRTEKSVFYFSALGLGNYETLIIDHPDNSKLCVPRIRIYGSGVYRSAMGKRAPGSSDELFIPPGSSRVQFSANGSGTLSLACYGRFA